MRIDIVETKVYKFDELSDEAKQAALEELYHTNVHDQWWDFVYECFMEETRQFDVTNIYFSGFWSQGDGAMFEYDGISRELFEEAIDSLTFPSWHNSRKEFMKAGGYFTASGKQSGHYYHENCCMHNMDFSANNCDHDNLDGLFYDYHDEIEEYIIDKYKELARDLYRRLEKEYDYLVSEEAIKETIECNEYEFTVDGKLY